ncbi:RIP metalloprotease RseP [Leptothrix ochracea]|uniref:RIP metalloprotease RseP n=1 Tax=Leptothrix ochracea TaxID=735331 RepID=UPI0034E28832
MTAFLAFLLTLSILVLVHEWGHYRVATACGVKVLRFSLGFGRVIWSKQRGETEWVLSALPLGGYVRMLDEREGEVAPDELHRAFNRKSLKQRAAIVAAGPLANLILAVALYMLAGWIGTDEPVAQVGSPMVGSLAERAGLRAGDRLLAVSTDQQRWDDVESMTQVRWQMMQAVMDGRDLWVQTTDHRTLRLALSGLTLHDAEANVMRQVGLGAPYSEPLIGRVTPDGPADHAGLRQGDRVLQVQGQAVADAGALRALIRASVSSQGDVQPQLWQVQRTSQQLMLRVTPKTVDDHGQRIGRIEAVVGAPPELVRVRYGLIDGVTQAFAHTWENAFMSLRMLGRMLIGQASVRNLSGPLTIADYAGQSAQLGLAYYLNFLAIVSISLGVLNLLPLPVLDGGHLVYYVVEAVMGRPMSPDWVERLQRGGVMLILAMMSIALYNDVARLMG